MASFNASVGNVQLISLTDGHGEGDPVEIFPASSIDQWRNDYADQLDSNGKIHPRFGCLAVKSNGKLIIVDTGMDGTLIEDLQQKNISLESVDIVVITHMHPDHVGWNLTNGKPTFPNAKYVSHRSDWDYWTEPTVLAESPFITDQVIPLEQQGVLELVDGGYKLTDELTIVHTPGHTPGHVSIVINSGGETGYILGDVAHNIAQTQDTDWSPIFDVDGDLARKTRHKVFDHLESTGILISAGHFPEPGFGRLLRSGNRRIWSPE